MFKPPIKCKKAIFFFSSSPKQNYGYFFTVKIPKWVFETGTVASILVTQITSI